MTNGETAIRKAAMAFHVALFGSPGGGYPKNFLDAISAAVAVGTEQEREDLIACIRSTTWSGTEEIVAMIRGRK
jgi:hypothetical protein